MAERGRRTSLPSVSSRVRKITLSDTVTAFLSPSLPAPTPFITEDLDDNATTLTDTTTEPHDITTEPHVTTTELHNTETKEPQDSITHQSSSSKEKTEKHSDDATSLASTTDNFSIMEEMQGMHYRPVHRPSVSADTSLSYVDTSTEKKSDITSLSTEYSYSVMRDRAFHHQHHHKPQVTTILVQEKEMKGRKKPSSFDMTPDKQNPHIILVEPELSTGGTSERKESTGHVPILREPPEVFLAPLGGPRQRAKSYPYEDTETTSITPASITPLTLSPAMTPVGTPSITPQMSPIKEEEIQHVAGFKKFAALKLKARKWMKHSGGAEEPSQTEVETAMKQQRRPFVEIPRHLKLDIWKEAYPIVQKIHESYKRSLGEHDPLTQCAEAHLETHKAKFRGGAAPDLENSNSYSKY